MNTVFDLMSEEDLTPDLQMLVPIIGLDMVKKLLLEYSGLSFYVPKLSRLEKLVIKYIKKRRDLTTKQVAKNLNVSVQFVNRLYKLSKV